MTIDFVVPGKPVGKGRPRVTRHGTYTPEATRGYQRAVQWAWKKAGGKRMPKDTALGVIIQAYLPIPSGVGKKKRAEWDRLCRYHTKRPDGDNIAKAVLDALNGLAYDDDSAVSCLTVGKGYSEQPRTVVMIHTIRENMWPDEETRRAWEVPEE